MGDWENGLLKTDRKGTMQSTQAVNVSRKQNVDIIESNNKRKQNKKKITITGYVGNLNGPLIGASVIEKGTNNGVISDYEGNFTITAASDAIIQVSYVGYKTREKKAEKYMAFMLSEK